MNKTTRAANSRRPSLVQQAKQSVNAAGLHPPAAWIPIVQAVLLSARRPIRSRVPSANRTPSAVRSWTVQAGRLEVDPLRMVDAVRLGPAIRAALDNDGVRVYSAGALLIIEADRPDPITVPAERMPAGAIGVEHYGQTVQIDPTRSHISIAGRTGAGKTNTLAMLAYIVARDHPSALLAVADPKPLEILPPLATSSSLWRAYAPGPGPAGSLIYEAADELRRRIRDRDTQSPPLVVVADEAALLPRVPLQYIATQGRQARVFLSLGWQYRNQDQVDPITVESCAVRICGAVGSKRQSTAIISAPDAADISGAGQMIGRLESGRLVRFQAAYITPDVLAGLPRWNTPPEPARAIPANSSAPALNTPPAEPIRYERADDEPLIAWAIENGAKAGAAASAYAIKKHASCGTVRAQRIRDEAQGRIEAAGRPFLPSYLPTFPPRNHRKHRESGHFVRIGRQEARKAGLTMSISPIQTQSSRRGTSATEFVALSFALALSSGFVVFALAISSEMDEVLAETVVREAFGVAKFAAGAFALIAGVALYDRRRGAESNRVEVLRPQSAPAGYAGPTIAETLRAQKLEQEIRKLQLQNAAAQNAAALPAPVADRFEPAVHLDHPGEIVDLTSRSFDS